MLLSLNIQVKVKRGRRLGESPNFFFSSALQRLEAFSKVQKKDCGNYLTCLAPKIASSQKTSWTAAAQTKTTPDNNPELCIWLDFFPQLMQIEQNWPHAETQKIQTTASECLPWHGPHSEPHSKGTQMFPHSTKHNSPHCYLLTCWKIPILAWHQALRLPSLGEVGHSSNVEISEKVWVHLSFSFLPHTTRISNFAEAICIFSTQSFFLSKRCTCQNTCEPRHVRGNSSLQLVLEKHQAVISYLFIGRMLLPVSEQLQKDQDLVLKEL